MKGRQLAGAAIGAVGATAVANRLLAGRADPLSPPLERETGSYRWRGMNIEYTEGGDPEAPDMLLVHAPGMLGTSREFNRIFDRLAESYHVFAPDLPGFGRSDRPPLTYSSTLYETFLEDFIQNLTDRPIVVGSGLSGAYLAAAVNEVEIDRLLLVCPSTEARTRTVRGAGRLLRIPVIGQAAYNALTSRRGINRIAAKRALHSPERLAEHDRNYLWHTAHQPGARFAPAAMLAGHLDSALELGQSLAKLDAPTTLVWGREVSFPPLRDGRAIADFASVKLVVVDRARSMPHLEQSGAFFDILAEELEATG